VCTQQRKPGGLDILLSSPKFEQFKDPDGDEEELKELIKVKKERRAQLEASLAGGK
jgi:hypothetical protein